MQETEQENTDTSHLVSVGQAATVLGITQDGIRKRLQRGQLAGLKTEGVWYVRLDKTGDSSSGQPVQDTNTQHIYSPRRQDKNRAGHGARQDRLEALYRELVEQLKGENTSLRDQLAFQQQELERKDMLIAAFAPRALALPEPSQPSTPPVSADIADRQPSPSKPWWKFW